MGFLHRVNLGKVSEQIKELFTPVGSQRPLGDYIGSRVRVATARHSKQLLDRVTATSSEQFKRSIFGMVQCYNVLPQWIVDKTSVQSFQKALQTCVTARAKEGYEGWADIFTAGRRYGSILRFHAFFS